MSNNYKNKNNNTLVRRRKPVWRRESLQERLTTFKHASAV